MPDIMLLRYGATGFVRGMIILWSGTADSVPTGWHVCDGTNGTPDLRNRFIVGAGDQYDVGTYGGSASVTLTTEEIPAHKHDVSLTSDPASVSVIDEVSTTKIFAFSSSTSIVTGITQKEVEHTHTIEGSTEEVGLGAAHENRPPYYALCYIMKL